VKLLVCARHFGYLRNFEAALVVLAERGNQLHLTADRKESAGGLAMVQRLADRYPQVTVGWTPKRDKNDEWLKLATAIRLSADYLRYLQSAYDRAPMLRRRAKERTPALTVWLVEKAGFRFSPGRRILNAIFKLMEQGVPLHGPYTDFLTAEAPDVVMLTPMIDLGSPQLDLIRSARALGLRSVLSVGSWDHLSSKALIRTLPDMVTVWNDVQCGEAMSMHDVPEDRVTVTGAQCYDQWFDRKPSRSREAFCQEMGLAHDRPFVVYVCSSLFRGGPPEAEFTLQWIRRIRESKDPRLSGLGILVRPHPGRLDEWRSHDLSSLDVAMHGSNPIDDKSRDDYFDALYHSAAVVGLNTSAFLEAGIVGKPVLAVLPKSYWKSQEGTLHFHYLMDVGGGLLRTSRSIDEHLEQLSAAVGGEAPANHDDFIREFIRPHGLDQSSSSRYADAVELLASVPPLPPVIGKSGVGLSRLILTLRLFIGRWRGHIRHFRKDVPHDLQKLRIRVNRLIVRPIKRWSERGLKMRWRRIVPSTDRRRAWADCVNQDEISDVRQAITEMRYSGRPILVGPWLSETGFELLYWIPFLRWAQRYGHLRSNRIAVISRGGASSWYGDIASRYLDVLDLVSVQTFRGAQDQRLALHDGQKHYMVTPFDQEVARRAAANLGFRRYDWLHPGLMYNLFRAFWMQLAPSSLLRTFLLPRAMQVPALEPLPGLPDRYIAVKFYTNDALPSTPENQRFVRETLKRLSKRAHVVLLTTGLTLDDHVEYDGGEVRVHTLEHLMTPSTNLDIQTRVIASADAFVSTYGGFSYIGPMFGVKTLALYSNPAAFRIDHLEVAQRTFHELRTPPFVTVRTDDLRTLEGLLGSERVAVA